MGTVDGAAFRAVFLREMLGDDEPLHKVGEDLTELADLLTLQTPEAEAAQFMVDRLTMALTGWTLASLIDLASREARRDRDRVPKGWRRSSVEET